MALCALILPTLANAYTSEVNGGATITGETVSGGNQQIINGTANNTTIETGGAQYVHSGGTANYTTINAGGFQAVWGTLGGNTTINLDGEQIIWSSAGTSNFAFSVGTDRIIITGGKQWIGYENNDGSRLNYISLDSSKAGQIQMNYGTQFISNGSSIDGMTVNGISSLQRSDQFIKFGGTALNTVVGQHGLQVVMAGGTANGATINSGGEQDVLGILEGTTRINAGGKQFLLSSSAILGGATVVIDGGTQNIGQSSGLDPKYVDSTTAGKINFNSGVQNINNGSGIDGMTVKGTSASAKGVQNVNVGGTAVNTIVNDFGEQVVYAGATVTDTTVNSGGIQLIRSNASASDTVVNTGGKMEVQSAGAASGSIINSGGTATITRGGTITGATVNTGGKLELSNTYSSSGGNLYSPVANNTTLSGGLMTMAGNSWTSDGVVYGSIANNTTIVSGGTMFVGTSLYKNATANNTTITSGSQTVYGTLAGLTTIGTYGAQDYYGATIASGATIEINGGVQNIKSGTLNNNGNITFNSGIQHIWNGAIANNMMVASATSSIQKVSGTANKTTIGLNGQQIVNSGGKSSDATVNNGGVVTFKSGSILDGVLNAINSGGIVNLESGAEIGLSNAYYTVKTGGTMNIASGGIADFIRIDGGTMNLSGTAGSAIISNGGIQKVAAGGTVKGNTQINAGGIQEILAGASIGTSVDDMIAINGGIQRIGAAGTAATVTSAQAAKIKMNHGEQVVTNGSIDGMDISGISAGQSGIQTVTANGTASNTTIATFGKQNVYGTATDSVVNDGGIIAFKTSAATISGAGNTISAGGTILFESTSINGAGATLNLNGGRMALNGVGSFGASFAVQGSGGIIDVMLRSGNAGADSDFYTFSDISGTFALNLKYSNADIDALNSIGSIDIIQNNSSDKSLASFAALNNGVDIGLYNWNVVTDTATGLVSAVKSERASALVANTVNHAYSVRSVVAHLSNSMHKRVGELQWIDGAGLASDDRSNNGAWGRGIFKSAGASDARDAKLNLFGAEFGYDFKVLNSDANKIFIGLIGHAASGSAEFKTANSSPDKDELSAYGAGLYAIWLGNGGWFADAAARVHLVSQSVTAYAAGSPAAVTFDTDHTALSLNLDFGREMVFGAGKKLSWFLTPHAQLNGAYVSGSDIAISAGQNGKIEDSFNAQVQFSVMGGPRWNLASGAKLQFYAKAGYIADLSDDTSIGFAGMTLSDKFATGGIEFGGGLNWRGSSKRWSAYLDASARSGDNYNELGGIIGARYGF